MDSGATEHLTNEMGKLHPREPYHGSNKIHTANGAGMHISHIGQASLLTSHATRRLQLRDVLRVPPVTRNLLSVPKLTYDNNVFCEFHPFDLFIRIGTRGTFFLVGVSTRAFTVWSILESLGFSVEFASRRHSGMLILAILPHLSFVMFCVVMSFLVSRAIIM